MRGGFFIFFSGGIFIKLGLLCVGAGVVGSYIASLFGGFDIAAVTLVLFMAADYLSGVAAAAFFAKSDKSESGRLESKAGFKGLCRKCMILVFVAIGARLDLLLGTDLVRDAVCIGFTVNELISITENAGLMGVPIPKAIRKAIGILREREEDE